MKSILPLLALVVLASSCSTAYKSGQTPDDVYYSPAKVAVGNDYVQMDRNDNRRYREQQRRDIYDDPYVYNDDRYLRMKVRNRRVWSEFDYYYNDPFAFRNYNPFWGNTFWSPVNYWNAYSNWNYFHNPYYRPFGHVVVVNPSSPIYNRPRNFNMNTFGRTGSPGNSNMYKRGNSNNTYYSPGSNSGNNSNNSRTRSFGNDIRESFGNGRSSSNSSVTPSRSSSSPGSSSSGSSNAPVRKF